MRNPARACSLTIALLALLALAAGAAAQEPCPVLECFDYVFPDPNQPVGEPDPAVWALGGNLSPTAVEGEGLRIADPGDGGQLLYFHPSAALADPTNVAKLRATVKMFVNASAWSNNTTGLRLILDDSHRRLVVALGRDATTGAPQVVVLASTNPVTPIPELAIPFAWDTAFFHTYELARLANGDYLVTVTNGDPSSADPSVRLTIPAASLPQSRVGPVFLWGMDAFGGGVSTWQEVHASVESGVLPFASLAAAAQIALGPGGNDDWFAVEALFSLGEGSDGIDPLTEDVTLGVGPAGWVIPAGSFTRTRFGTYVFQGAIEGTRLAVVLQPLRGGRYFFAAVGDHAALDGTANPVPIALGVGNDGATTEVTAWLAPGP
jgi:hypothetical protein